MASVNILSLVAASELFSGLWQSGQLYSGRISRSQMWRIGTCRCTFVRRLAIRAANASRSPDERTSLRKVDRSTKTRHSWDTCAYGARSSPWFCSSSRIMRRISAGNFVHWNVDIISGHVLCRRLALDVSDGLCSGGGGPYGRPERVRGCGCSCP